MTFESFIIKPNPKKVKEDNLYNLEVAGVIIILLFIYIFLFSGLIVLLLLGGMAYSLIQLRLNDIKKKGPIGLGV